MAKKTMLEQARKAYNKSASTKYRVQANGKRTKKKKEKVKSHYGNIQKKTQNTEENRREARNQTKNVVSKVGSNVVKKKTTESKPTTTVTNKQNGRRSGAITSVSSKSAERRTGAATARTTAKNVGNAVKTSTNLHKTPLKVTDVTQGTAKGTAAGTAYNKSKATDKALQKAGEKKTLTVSREQLTAEQKAAQERAARQTRFYTNSLVASGRMTQKQADDAVEKARKNAKKGVKEDHTLTYSNSAQSNETVQRVANASKFANVEVEDKKAAEKAMREARFYANSQVAAGKMTQKEADRLVKQAGKGHRTTQSANILDKLGGEGEAERQGTRQAGQLNDSKFASGVMQGLSYADNTRAVGKYNKQAAELVDTVKQSGAFNTGYMVGQAGQFMLGGTGKMTDALVKGVAKSGAARSALNIGLRKAGADALFESPINALDAVKMSTDANGNFDKNAFVKYMALNTGLSGGMGGVIGGVGSKLAKNDAKAYITLSAKANSGAGLTEQEKVRLVNLQKKMDSIRNGNDVANTDIVNKADYDAEVSKKVFEKGGTVDDAIKVVNGGGTHTEKIGYANSIKETANAEFERLRVAREQMLEQARNTTPEEAKLLRAQASKLSSEINRLGEISNTAEKQLSIELKRNRKAVAELADNVKNMSDATGVNYRVVDDKQMRKLIKDAGGDVSDDYFYKGFYYKNKDGQTEILINGDSPQAHQTVIGHETGHLIKDSNEKEFGELGDMLEEYAKKQDDFDAVYNQLKRSYPDASEAELREEVTCELLGRYVYGADDKFIKQLAGEKPSVVQRIVEYLKRLFNNTSDKEMAKELKAIIDKTEGLVKRIDNTTEAKTPKNSSSDARFSKQQVDKTSRLFAPVGKDGMRSKAWEVVANDLKGEKFGAKDLPKMLEGKGVKAEELKWTGLEAFLDGKKSVSKQELMDFFASNTGELKTVKRIDGSLEDETRVSREILSQIDEDSELYKKLYDAELDRARKTADEFGLSTADIEETARANVEDFTLDSMHHAGYSDDEIQKMFDVDFTGKETRYENYMLDGAENYREYEYIMEGNEFQSDHWGEEGVVIHSRIGDFSVGVPRVSSDEFSTAFSEISSRSDEISSGINDLIKRRSTSDLPRTADTYNLGSGWTLHVFIPKRTRKVHFKLGRVNETDGFNEAISRATIHPDDITSGEKSIDNIIDELKSGAKTPDKFGLNEGGRTLYVDEIQSDLHNKGHKNGYKEKDFDVEALRKEGEDVFRQYSETRERLSPLLQELRKTTDGDDVESLIREQKKLAEKAQQIRERERLNGANVYAEDWKPPQDLVDVRQKLEELNSQQEKLRDDILGRNRELNESVQKIKKERDELWQKYKDIDYKIRQADDAPPDAPYKKNYTDYAMKRALREAVENDYEYLAWSTGKIHDERWQGALDYTVEYDTIIPKFMKKYVKQWNGTVEKIRLAENGEEVWAVKITPEMRESVSSQGQYRFSKEAKPKQKPPKGGSFNGVIESLTKNADSAEAFSKAEKKEITDTLAEISKALENGDVSTARSIAEDLAQKYGKIDEGYKVSNDALWEEVKGAQEYLRGITIHTPEGSGALKEIKEKYTGDADWHNIHIRQSKNGKIQSQGVDEVWDELVGEFPEVFSREITDPMERLQKLSEVSSMRKADTQDFAKWSDEDISSMREDMVDEILASAEKNIPAKSEADYYNGLADSTIEDAKELVGSAKETPKAEPKKTPKAEAPKKASTDNSKEPSLDDMPAGLSKDEVVKYVEKEYGSKDAFLKKMGEERWREKRPETAKIFYDNKYASDELKKSIIDINKAGIAENVEKTEKAAKKFNDIDGKIAGLQNRLNNAKNKDYPTEAEKTAHIAELEDELRTLRNRQNNVAGKIEQMGKMKAVDDSIDPQDQFHQLRGETSRTNKELQNADNLKNEDNWIKDKWNSVRRLWEDSLIEVENVAKRSDDKKLREEILTAANRVRNSQNVANFWITKGRSSFDNKVSGKALDEIFTKELLDDEAKYKDFQEYLIMKHVPARHEKGTDIYPEVSPELADKIVKKLEAKYNKTVEVNGKKMTEIEAWANDVYDYLKDLQQYRVDSGMLSQKAADKFAKDYPFYVPTNRARDDEPIDFFTGGLSNQIRTARGGENDVLDMYSQLYTATNKTIHAAEENEMLNLYFRAKGVTPEQIKGAEPPDLEHAVIEANVNKKTGSATVSFFIDGKPVKFPCSHQLALGLRELDGLEFERLMNAAKVSTLYGKPFKALITDWNLVFGVRNGMRDMQQAVVNSKDTRYFGSSFGAAGHAIAHEDSPYRKLYASMGGERAQLVSYDAVAKNLGIEKQGKIDAVHEKVQDWVDADIKGVHTNPVHYIEGINGAIEMMPRMCEFIGTLRKQADKTLKQQGSSLKKLRKEIIDEVNTLEKEGKIGQSEVPAEVENRLANRIIEMADKDTIDSAMRNANDITLNFGRSGVLGKALNMGFVPYLNPSIQGLSKLVRLFSEAGQEGGWKALASIGMKLGTFTIAPAVWNELALRNNEEYQSLNTRDKDNNFFIALGDGKFIKIPKPRENAVLAEPVEYGLRYFLDKSEYAFFDWDKLSMETEHLWEKIPLTDEGKQAFRTAIDNIGVINPATSNMVSPLWDTFHNRTWYGGNIESAYETSINEDTGKANVPVNKRYDVGTTGVAIWLGQTNVAKALNLSPKKIDNILDSYTGMIYDLYLSQTTEEAKTRGNYLLRTAASQFMKDSVFSNKLSTKAWEKTDGMTKKEQDEYKSKYMYDAYKYDDAMDAITADKNMTVKEKMEAKRFLQKQRNKLYRAAINGEPNETNPLKDISKYLGANKTLNKFLPKSGDEQYDNWTDYYKNYKKTKGYKGLTPAQKEKEAQKFLDVYTLGVKGQSKISSDFHDSPSWGMTGVAAAQRYKQGKLSQKDAETIMQSCGVYESQTASYFKYADHGGNVSRYAVTKKNNNKAEDLAESMGVTTSGDGSIWKNKYSKEKGIKGGVLSMSLATGKADFKDRAYYISNSGDSNMLIKMNAARGYAEKYGHSTKQLIKLGKKADSDGNTYLSNDEIESACQTIKKGKATSEEKAMAWVLLGGNPNKNPFGAIGDYSHDGDTGITMDGEEKSGGRGGHGWGRRRHRGGGGGGGSSKGTVPKTASGAIKGTVTDPFSGISRIGGRSGGSASTNTRKSNLNDAYRKRVKKLRQNLS